MPPHTNVDLARIADALGVEIAAVKEYAGHLDGARVFVEFHGRAMPMTPTATQDHLLKVSASARRLLNKLGALGRVTGASEYEGDPGKLGPRLSARKQREAVAARTTQRRCSGTSG